VELAGADAALVDWVEVLAAPAKGITAIQKAATVVDSPSFVLALADSFSLRSTSSHLL
jgi:hypothetical protein